MRITKQSLATYSIAIWTAMAAWSFVKYEIGHDEFYKYSSFAQAILAVCWLLIKFKQKTRADVR